MPLAPGTRLGPYDVVEPLGAGGMGEVYRARDTKLNRDVAIKVLPELFALDADRLKRFEREAQTLAALNHPHIAQIYGLEDRALVMELVEGEDLSRHLARGPLPLEQALAIATQIAAALEAAHEQGIIHRDLKPANVKVRPDGTVKVLDFGLAKALDPVAQGSGPARPGIENSPTFTSPAMTQMGIILGTAAYMAPEQARGRAVDKRADIWAFGCVLFEMLSGRQAFRGDSITDVIAAIVKEDPDWGALPDDLPRAVRRLLQRCLRKDLRDRLHDISDARIELDEVRLEPAGAETQAVRGSRGHSRGISLALGGVAGLLLVLCAYLGWLVSRPAASPPVVRFVINTPAGADLRDLTWPVASLSPDGRRLAIMAGGEAGSMIYLRSLDSVEMTPLAGTQHAYNPFFSPDGKWLAFTADQKLKRVPVAGGQPHVIADANWGGGDWGPDDVIVFTPHYTGGLWKVSASGGKPVQLTQHDPAQAELGHWWPQFLPDGRHVVFTSFSTPLDRSRVMLYSLDTGAQRVLVAGAYFGRVLASGHLVYARAHGMAGVPFDLGRAEITGPEVPVLDGAATYSTNGVVQMAVAANGTMAFIPVKEARVNSELVWLGPNGTVTPAIQALRRHTDLRLSPDGRRVALTIEGESRDVWAYDFDRGVLGRVTSGAASEFQPRWSADGRKILFASEQPVFQIFMKPPVATAPDEPLVTGEYDTTPTSVSPDGKYLVYTLSHPATQSDLWIRPLVPEGPDRPLIATQYVEENGEISPDGRWIAYTSDESGRPELYVQEFPDPTERWQVSTSGAAGIRWGPGGRAVFYAARSPERIVSVALGRASDGGLVVGKPVTVFEGRFDDYDVAADGRILLLRRDPTAAPPSMHVVLNWFEEVRAKLSRR